MELAITKKVNYLIPSSLFIGAFILSMIQINETSLPFVLPLLIISFCSNYTNLAVSLLAMTIGMGLTQQIFTTIVIYTFLCVLFVLNVFKIMKTKQLPFLFSFLLVPFLYINQYAYFEIIFITLLNLVN